MSDFKIQVRAESGETSMATISLELLKQSNLQLTLTLIDGKIFQAVAMHGFEALRKLRLETEKLGLKLLIQGCRPNCWPSGMTAQMSNGTRIYARNLNNNKAWELVNTFDSANESEIGTLSDQDDFNEKLKELLKNYH